MSAMTDAQLRELRDAIDAHLAGQPVEWLSPSGNWYLADQPISHYFVHVLRPKREPATRPWNCPADVPMPVCWLRSKSAAHEGLRVLLINVSERGFEHYIADRSDRFVRWGEKTKLDSRLPLFRALHACYGHHAIVAGES